MIALCYGEDAGERRKYRLETAAHASTKSEYEKDDPVILFQVYRGREGLEMIADGWNELVRSLPEARFFQFPTWYRSYLATLEPEPEKVWFAVAYRGGTTAVVCPFRESVRSLLGMPVRVLQSVTHPHMNLADFIFARTPENAGVVRELVGWLRRQREIAWDALSLDLVPGQSSISYALDAAPSSWLVRNATGSSSYVLCDCPYEEATKEVSNSFKRNLRRFGRRAEATAPLSHYSYREIGDLKTALARFLAIEASGWKGTDGTGSAILCSAPLAEFYGRLTTGFGAEGKCVITILRQGETDVAGHFGIHIGRTLNLLKIGYSGAHASFAPGNLLMERVLQESCMSKDVYVVSFVTQPPWGHLWKSQQEPVASYRISNLTMRGLIYHMIYRIKQVVDKRRAKRQQTTTERSTTD